MALSSVQMLLNQENGMNAHFFSFIFVQFEINLPDISFFFEKVNL